MKIKFTLLVISICALCTSYSAIADTEKPQNDINTKLEEGCMRTCLDDYTKIAKCDINEMIGEYISELNKEN